MKIGVRAHDFGRMSPEDLSSCIRKAGFEAVQLAPTKAILGIRGWDDITPADLTAIQTGFARNQVEISILGCYIEPALPDKQARMQQVENFLLALSYAKELGVPFVGTETTRLDPFTEETLRPERYRNLKDSVLRMVEHAERLGVQVAIEPVADHTLNTAGLTRLLLDEVGSDCLKVIFDPVNLILEHTAELQTEVYEDFFRLLGEEIAVAHIKDIVFDHGEKVWRNIGQGSIDLNCVFRWLRQNKPQIAALREHVRPESSGIDLAAMKQLAGISS